MTYPICKSCNGTFQTMEKRRGKWLPIGHDGKVHKCPPSSAFKAATTAIAAATLIGCASSEIKGTEPPYFMHREMVIQATTQCEEAEMRPRVVYGYQIIQDRRVPVPIDVQCEPSAWRKSK